MSLGTQLTIVMQSMECTTNDIISTCELEPCNMRVRSDRLSPHDLSILYAYLTTTDEKQKKLFDHLYLPLRIKRMMPVKVVYLEEILVESNSTLISKALRMHDDLVHEHDDYNMSIWVNMLGIYGMTWDIIYSLYIENSTILGNSYF